MRLLNKSTTTTKTGGLPTPQTCVSKSRCFLPLVIIAIKVCLMVWDNQYIKESAPALEIHKSNTSMIRLKEEMEHAKLELNHNQTRLGEKQLLHSKSLAEESSSLRKTKSSSETSTNSSTGTTRISSQTTNSPRTTETSAPTDLVENKQQQQQQQQEEEWWQAEHLPMFPWERESITKDTCNPPEGIPVSCCSRSTTQGGGQPVNFFPQLCTTEIERYENVEAKAKEFLHQHPIIDSSGMGCDVCRIIQIMQQQNWTTLVVMGDSMTRQTFEGFKCELYRRGYQIQFQMERPFDDPYKGGIYKRVKEKHTITLSNITATSTSTSTQQSIQIILYIKYRINVKSVQQVILGGDSSVSPRPPDVLVFDHSLWYRHWEQSMFEEQMTELLTAIYDTNNTNYNTPKLVFWREQSAQHFNTDGGQYSPSQEALVPEIPGTGGCVPILKDRFMNLYWHTTVMKNITQALGIRFVEPPTDDTMTKAVQVNDKNNELEKSLYFIPFRNFSSQFYDIHRSGECTHYCPIPDLWMSIHRIWRLHMDKYVRGLQQVAQ